MQRFPEDLREIDALIARYIMDWRNIPDSSTDYENSKWYQDQKWYRSDNQNIHYYEPFRYSENTSFAVSALENIKSDNESFEFYLEKSYETDGLWQCTIMWIGEDKDGAPDYAVQNDDKSLSMAICKSLLEVFQLPEGNYEYE